MCETHEPFSAADLKAIHAGRLDRMTAAGRARYDAHCRQHDQVTARVAAEYRALGALMRLPLGPEAPNLLALRRMARVVVAVPTPRNLRAEVYGADEAEAVRVLATGWSRADLVEAARLRGITDVSSRATRRDLARALVYLGASWFDEIPPDEDPDDVDQVDDGGDDFDPDDVADLVAHDAAVGLPGFTRVD